MQTILEQILAADGYAWTVITFMAFLFAAFVSSALGNALYSLVFYPGFVAGGLVANWLARNGDLTLVPDRKISVIIESAVGMTLALVVLLIAARLFMALYGLTIRPPTQAERATRAVGPR